MNGDNFEAGDNYGIYVVGNSDWTGGETLGGENVCPVVTVTADVDGSFSPELVLGESVEGYYDVIADNGDGIFNPSDDGLDDMDVGGAGLFVVPELASVFSILACIGALVFIAFTRRASK